MVKLKIKSTGVDIEVVSVVNKLTLIIKNNYIF